jgi:hypothetical protein
MSGEEDSANGASKKTAARKTAKKTAGSDEIVALYEKLVATIPGLERKGDANPYTSMNGNMFTLLHQSRALAIRLPDDKRDEFLKKYKTKLFEAYGAVMKEYVAVPDAMLPETRGTREILQSELRVRQDAEAEANAQDGITNHNSWCSQ